MILEVRVLINLEWRQRLGWAKESFWEKETARIPQTISLDHGLRWQRAGEDEELISIKVSAVCSGADSGSLKTAFNIHNNYHYKDNGCVCAHSCSCV